MNEMSPDPHLWTWKHAMEGANIGARWSGVRHRVRKLRSLNVWIYERIQ